VNGAEPTLLTRRGGVQGAVGRATRAYVQTASPDYLLTLLTRGSNAAARAGEIGQELVDGFDQEARRRARSGFDPGCVRTRAYQSRVEINSA
jgi:hypothetical protein